MDNPGDWLYIVLMAVAVISSIISAVKKKKQEVEPHEQPKPESETADEASEEKGFWEVLQDMQRQEEAKQQEETRRQQQARETVSTSRPARSPFLAGEKTTMHIPHQDTLVPDSDPIPLITAETFNDPEELRKAVILTEILNRKY